MVTTTKSTESQDDIRKEFDALKSQVSELIEALKQGGKETAAGLGRKLEDEIGQYQRKAEEKFKDVYEVGEDSLNDLSKRVRKDPVSSLLIAFSIGYVISKILNHNK